MRSDNRWEERALCALDPEFWFSEGTASAAIHQCLVHCPVLQECQDKAFRTKPCAGVMGGVRWIPDKTSGSAQGVPARWHSKPSSCSQCAQRNHALSCAYCGLPVHAKNKGEVHLICKHEYDDLVNEIRLLLGARRKHAKKTDVVSVGVEPRRSRCSSS